MLQGAKQYYQLTSGCSKDYAYFKNVQNILQKIGFQPGSFPHMSNDVRIFDCNCQIFYYVTSIWLNHFRGLIWFEIRCRTLRFYEKRRFFSKLDICKYKWGNESREVAHFVSLYIKLFTKILFLPALSEPQIYSLV